MSHISFAPWRVLISTGAAATLWTAAAGMALANTPQALPSGALVSTEWLAANLQRPDVRVIEVSVNPGL